MNRILVYGLSQDTTGGIETYLLNMNKFMSNETIFDYVIEGNHTIHQNDIDEKGGKCFFISPKKKVFSNLKDWKKLLKEQKDNYKIAYFNLYSLAWIFPIKMALKQGYKVIVHAHNNKLHNCGIVQKLLHTLNRQYQKHLKIIRFTNSDLSSKFFFGNKNSELIYNAIDFERFRFDENKRNQIRGYYGFSNDDRIYGFSGRICYQKNPLFLIDIFYELSKIDPRAKFLICGEGDLFDEMELKSKLYKLNVVFTGSVNNIESYYQAMDCFVLPSRFEGLGIVLIEAQVSGLLSFTSEDVVPENAKTTELLHFISLKRCASDWANEITKYNDANYSRSNYSRVVSPRFNILNESKRLEDILTNYSACTK